VSDPTVALQIGMNKARSMIWRHMSGSDRADRLIRQMRGSAPLVEKVTCEDARALLKAAVGRAR
jgi:hypothetical protein